MQTLNGSSTQAFGDTAISDTARDLRSMVQSAIDPPRTSRQVRKAQLKDNLWRDVILFCQSPQNRGLVANVLATVSWAEAFIDVALATTPEPEIAVDADGEVLFEWLNGPRDAVTVSVGPGGLINFASLAGSDRFHGITRIGERVSSPLLTRLGQLESAAA